MITKIKNLISIALFLLLISCTYSIKKENAAKLSLPTSDELFAWCIVPFDSVKRNPDQRISMLKELGISSYAYDWRNENLSEMIYEWNLAKENDIQIKAVWLWIDARADSVGSLSKSNKTLLANIDSAKLQTQVWVSFHENYFMDLTDSAKLDKAVEILGYVHDEVTARDCTLGLYNHGDWFGEPANQAAIIERMSVQDVGIIYNFHHGHHQVENFPEIVDSMISNLWAVNINGMKIEGPKILAVGKGDHEVKMLKTLINAGYDGPIGILGHVEEADVSVILQENINGYSKILEALE